MSIFNSVKIPKVPKSVFKLDHYRKFTMPMAKLIPILCEPINPNETHHLNHEVLIKFSPLLAPMMEHVDFFVEDFFVPNRILWKNFEVFLPPSQDGTFPAHPRFGLGPNVNNACTRVGGLLDYLGYPVYEDIGENSLKLDEMPVRAYCMIWNEYYRDQNLQPEIDIQFENDGNSDFADLRLRYPNGLLPRCWPKDYFTSALPTTQRGGDVRLPLYGEADITFDANAGTTRVMNVGDLSVNDPTYNRPWNLPSGNSTFDPGETAEWAWQNTDSGSAGAGNSSKIALDNSSQLKADLSSVTSATINELRQAVALQEYLELNMRVGGRYIEYLLGNFNSRVPDYRLDRPQFLGGYRSPIVVNQVDQTSQSSEISPLGAMAGGATGVGGSRLRKFHSVEDGWLISLLSVLPKASYQQGLRRTFSRLEPLDYFNPKFANLGEQAILNKEIYAKSEDPDGVFGYTPRYAEYKFVPSTVHGEMRTTLNFWHMGRIFENEPKLNSDFVTADPTRRVFAVDGDDQLRVMVKNKWTALRPMPYYGTPKLL